MWKKKIDEAKMNLITTTGKWGSSNKASTRGDGGNLNKGQVLSPYRSSYTRESQYTKRARCSS